MFGTILDDSQEEDSSGCGNLKVNDIPDEKLVNLEQLFQQYLDPESWIVTARLWFLPTIVWYIYCASHILMPKNPLKTSLNTDA